MLRFNGKAFGLQVHQNKFQYILCYGSTREYTILVADFKEFQYILCYGSTAAAIRGATTR